MDKFLQKIPRPLLVFLVLVLGVGYLFIAQRPHHVCDSQIELLTESLRGSIFPLKLKNGSERPAFYEKALANCKFGQASPGACFEYFKIIKKLNTELENLSPKCGEMLFEVDEYKKVMTEAVHMYVQIAWGETPPEKGEKVTGWLEPADIADYCKLKDYWFRLFSEEAWDQLRTQVYKNLYVRQFMTGSDGKRVCTNCENPTRATEFFPSKEDIFQRSLFAIRCERY